MKLKRVLNKVEEEFVAGKNPMRGDYTEIFKNPTLDEIEDSLREWGEYPNLRFLAIKNSRDVYVWNPSLIHKNVQNEVGLSFKEMKYENLAGIAIYVNRELVFGMSNIASMDKYRRRELAEEILNNEWDWIEDYRFNIFPMKEDCEKYLETGEWEMGQVGI